MASGNTPRGVGTSETDSSLLKEAATVVKLYQERIDNLRNRKAKSTKDNEVLDSLYQELNEALGKFQVGLDQQRSPSIAKARQAVYQDVYSSPRSPTRTPSPSSARRPRPTTSTTSTTGGIHSTARIASASSLNRMFRTACRPQITLESTRSSSPRKVVSGHSVQPQNNNHNSNHAQISIKSASSPSSSSSSVLGSKYHRLGRSMASPTAARPLKSSAHKSRAAQPSSHTHAVTEPYAMDDVEVDSSLNLDPSNPSSSSFDILERQRILLQNLSTVSRGAVGVAEFLPAFESTVTQLESHVTAWKEKCLMLENNLHFEKTNKMADMNAMMDQHLSREMNLQHELEEKNETIETLSNLLEELSAVADRTNHEREMMRMASETAEAEVKRLRGELMASAQREKRLQEHIAEQSHLISIQSSKQFSPERKTSGSNGIDSSAAVTSVGGSPVTDSLRDKDGFEQKRELEVEYVRKVFVSLQKSNQPSESDLEAKKRHFFARKKQLESDFNSRLARAAGQSISTDDMTGSSMTRSYSGSGSSSMLIVDLKSNPASDHRLPSDSSMNQQPSRSEPQEENMTKRFSSAEALDSTQIRQGRVASGRIQNAKPLNIEPLSSGTIKLESVRHQFNAKSNSSFRIQAAVRGMLVRSSIRNRFMPMVLSEKRLLSDLNHELGTHVVQYASLYNQFIKPLQEMIHEYGSPTSSGRVMVDSASSSRQFKTLSLVLSLFGGMDCLYYICQIMNESSQAIQYHRGCLKDILVLSPILLELLSGLISDAAYRLHILSFYKYVSILNEVIAYQRQRQSPDSSMNRSKETNLSVDGIYSAIRFPCQNFKQFLNFIRQCLAHQQKFNLSIGSSEESSSVSIQALDSYEKRMIEGSESCDGIANVFPMHYAINYDRFSTLLSNKNNNSDGNNNSNTNNRRTYAGSTDSSDQELNLLSVHRRLIKQSSLSISVSLLAMAMETPVRSEPAMNLILILFNDIIVIAREENERKQSLKYIHRLTSSSIRSLPNQQFELICDLESNGQQQLYCIQCSSDEEKSDWIGQISKAATDLRKLVAENNDPADDPDTQRSQLKRTVNHLLMDRLGITSKLCSQLQSLFRSVQSIFDKRAVLQARMGSKDASEVTQWLKEAVRTKSRLIQDLHSTLSVLQTVNGRINMSLSECIESSLLASAAGPR
eukprot:GILJ01006754.1.p1 GENE.GILJ01006754.1~~GILJ01006754.1.p1  ORF type:complete len:1174 (+),score=234.70 GILJ01006754.1:2451-5972(+)